MNNLKKHIYGVIAALTIMGTSEPFAMEAIQEMAIGFTDSKQWFKPDSFQWEIMQLPLDLIGEVKSLMYALVEVETSSNVWNTVDLYELDLSLADVSHDNPIIMNLLFKRSLQKNCFLDIFCLYYLKMCEGDDFGPDKCAELYYKKANLLNRLFFQWHVQPTIILKFDLSDLPNEIDRCRTIFESITKFDTFKNPHILMELTSSYNEDKPLYESQKNKLLDFVKNDRIRHLPLILTLAAETDNAGMLELQLLPNLTGLDFGPNACNPNSVDRPLGVDDEGLRLLTNLQILDINGNVNITDRGLEPLTKLRCLNLGLYNRNFTYDGLKLLTNLTNLNANPFLDDMVGPNLSEDVLNQLKKDIPDLTITRSWSSNSIYD